MAEDPADLFSDRKRASLDQRPEFLLRHRQVVDMLVAGRTDDKDIAFTLFRARFLRVRDCGDTVQFQHLK